MTDASGASNITSSPETIRRILDECRTIAVVGLSSNPTRPSYGVASSMQQQGYRIIPVNPLEMPVLGERAYALLAAVPEQVDLVSVFRKSEGRRDRRGRGPARAAGGAVGRHESMLEEGAQASGGRTLIAPASGPAGVRQRARLRPQAGLRNRNGGAASRDDSATMGAEHRRQATFPLPPLGDADRQAEAPEDDEGDGEEPGAAGHSNDAQAGHQREQVEHDTGHVQALLN
ncbi:MAG: hypothetical protein FD129_3030 [bacterium]|nr:MAG: hypothetical protein FD129_3030 [bacterium]